MAIFRFGRCELDSARHRLLVAGIERHVEPQVFDLLQFMIEKGDTIVTHDELIERVWKGRIVSDSAISVRINAARKVVGDTGSRQAVIKTIPRRGFKLAVEVTRLDDEPALAAQSNAYPKTAGAFKKPVVGIFPFEALSDAMPPYLIRGIAEDLATELSRFHSIEVIAPYSTFRHNFNEVTQLEIARSLGITHLVTGSLKGDSSVQRINVSLLDADNENIYWSERYDVQGEDVFEAEDDAVNQIVSALIQGLTAHQSAVARRKPTSNLSAYECVLRALQIYKWGVNSMDEAKQSLFWFDRAIELDPEYARAMAWRECCNSSFWSSPPTTQEIDTAAENMRHALALDENDHEVNRLKGALHMCSGEHEPGEYHLAKSVELNPNDAHILLKIGMYHSFLAQHDDDLTYIETAFTRNPLHPSWYWQDRGIALFAHGEYEEVINSIHRCDSDNEIACLYLAAAHAQLGMTGKAKSIIGKLHRMNPDANINWLEVAYPTRCYEESECKERFFDGLRIAGL